MTSDLYLRAGHIGLNATRQKVAANGQWIRYSLSTAEGKVGRISNTLKRSRAFGLTLGVYCFKLGDGELKAGECTCGSQEICKYGARQIQDGATVRARRSPNNPGWANAGGTQSPSSPAAAQTVKLYSVCVPFREEHRAFLVCKMESRVGCKAGPETICREGNLSCKVSKARQALLREAARTNEAANVAGGHGDQLADFARW
ncbi:hypothetical protein B0H13DRAFT_1910431 [Mycena leptocephala]|nr:hypothetical protein B0H13DRAFT_1910431 [Mycena leptocephala]